MIHKTLLALLCVMALAMVVSCQLFAATPAAVIPTQMIEVPAATQPEPTAEPEIEPTGAPTERPTGAPRIDEVPTIVPTEKTEMVEEISYGQTAEEYLTFLAEEIGARWPGTDEERAAGDYVEGVLEGQGYAVETQAFTFKDAEEGSRLESANLIAIRPGKSTEQIVVGAHYDSSTEADGADDNASGVAVMLEVAGLLAEMDAETPYTIVFVAFGAEENNLDGSRYYVREMDRGEIGNTVAMINLDSLIAGDFAYVYGDDGPGTLRDWILAEAEREGLALEGKTAEDMDEDGIPCECADYHAFQQAGIPFAYFEATDWTLGGSGMTQVNPRYGDDGEIRHTEYDTLEYMADTFPNRADHHLALFVALLYRTLVGFQ